jgi:autotransporter translocation and assembly factor TamB
MVAKILRFVVGGLARVVALLIALALLLPVLVVLYTTTHDFRTRLLARLEPELDGRMDGALSIGGLEGSPLGRLRLVDVALDWHGEEIARIDAVGIEVDWTSLLFGRLQIAEVALERPAIVFREHPELGWDWRSALAPLIPSPDDPRPPREEPLPIVIESLAFREGSLTIASLERPAIRLDGLAARGRLDFGERRLSVADASLEVGDSKLSGSGEVPFKGRSAFEITIGALHPRDLARIDPGLAESLAFLPPASGDVVLGLDRDEIDATGQLVWPDTKLGFDLHGRPKSIRLADSTIAARLESADLARFAPVWGVAGQLDLRLELVNGEGRYAGRLSQGQKGELEVEGLLTLLDTPSTKLQFAVNRFDLARAFPAHPEWAGSLTGRGTLDARGRDRSALAGSVALSLSSSRIGELGVRRGDLRAKLAKETIELAELVVDSPIGRLEAQGRISTKPRGPVSLRASVDVGDLGPLLALARQSGAGRLQGRLEIEGQPARARVKADLAVADFRLGGFETTAARLVLDARGGIERERLDATIGTARLETALGVWSLESPARLRAAADALEWTTARFSSEGASLALDGRLARRGRQDFRLEARALPIAVWARAHPELLSPELLTGGTLDVDLAIAGTGAAPAVDARLVPRDLVVSEQAIDAAEAELHFAARRLQGKLSATASPKLRLAAEAELPFELAWQSGFVARPRGALDARAECEADDLAVLQGFVDEQIKNLGGQARCQIALVGPLDALRPSGTVTASALTGSPVRTGITVVGGELAVELAADRFFVRRASATVAGHEDTARFRAEGEGPLPTFLTRLTRSAPPVGVATAADVADAPNGDYTTKIEIESWPLVDTRRDRLITSGELRARGTFEAPHVEGRISILEGTLRPNLTFLSSGPPPRDKTIVFEEDEALANAGAPNGGGPNLLSTFDALELDVEVKVGRDLWIKHEQAEALLTGRIEARKRRERPLVLEGRIETQRGFVDLQNRRFRLIEGSLELVGGTKIDPELDVLARYRAPAHTIDARLTGTVSKPVLTLTSDPSLSQEDILAVLLFGRPASELSEAQQASLGQRAEEMASAFGMTAVGRTVASAIGLDALGLQIEELSSARARLGAYVGRNIFVALAQEFSGERGQELSIEYEFWPGWSIVGSTTSQGTNSADLVWKVRY